MCNRIVKGTFNRKSSAEGNINEIMKTKETLNSDTSTHCCVIVVILARSEKYNRTAERIKQLALRFQCLLSFII
jgi:hypothetical protein